MLLRRLPAVKRNGRGHAVKRGLGSPSSLPAGSLRPHIASSRSAPVPVSGVPAPRVQSRSLARNSIPARSAPKNLTVLSFTEAGSTRRRRSSGIAKGRPSGTVMSRPWITSWASAPEYPPPGGRHGWPVFDLTASASSAGDIRAASRRATRSAISLNRPRDLELPDKARPAVPERHRDVRHDLPHAPARAQRGLVPAAGRQGVKHGRERAALGGDHVLDGVHRVSR